MKMSYRIRELRQERGWTQTQLGDRVGMAKTTISGYERDNHQVDPTMICKLCDLFGCSADYLLGRSDTLRPALSDEDAQLLDAFHHAPEATQDAIRLLIMPVSKQKKGVS